MSPADLAKVAAKYGVSKDVARLSLDNLGTGGSDINITERTEKPACPPKRIRQDTKPILNKLETEFYQILNRRIAGSGYRILMQSLRFQLANGIWYKPDLIVWGHIIQAFEVKGPHAFRGGFENLKVAANRYPFIAWRLVWKENGQWQEQEVLP